MATQLEKAQTFKTLHEGSDTFIIPNPWDAGSARLLQSVGFKALATTSAGFAQSLGRLDGQISVHEKIEHCRAVTSVTDIPVSADFENGFADSPEKAAENLTKVAEAGVVGASIEDYSGSEIYDFGHAVERIAACAEAVSRLSFPFTLTARAENLLRGVSDLDNTIKRLQAFEAAGASVLYAPGLTSVDQVKRVVDSVNKPVNVLSVFMPDVSLTEFAELGVRRISIGSMLANHAIGATLDAAKKMLGSADIRWMKDAAAGAEVGKIMAPRL